MRITEELVPRFGAEPLEIVCEGDQSDLDVHPFNSSQIEPLEPFVLFYIPEHRLDLPSLFSFFQSDFASEQFSDSLFVADQIRRSLYDAVAISFTTGTSHRTSLAVVRAHSCIHGPA